MHQKPFGEVDWKTIRLVKNLPLNIYKKYIYKQKQVQMKKYTRHDSGQDRTCSKNQNCSYRLMRFCFPNYSFLHMILVVN